MFDIGKEKLGKIAWFFLGISIFTVTAYFA